MRLFNYSDYEKAISFAAAVHGADKGGHGLDHVLRVVENARYIINADKLCVDEHFVAVCCALHDVDDRKLVKGEGTTNIFRFCADNCYSEETRERIEHIISKVAFSSNGSRDDSLCTEAQIVQDADRLDALGAIGICRAFAYGGKTGRSMFDGEASTVSHFYDKLFKLPELMNTGAGEKLASERVSVMRAFIDRLNDELGGKA